VRDLSGTVRCVALPSNEVRNRASASSCSRPKGATPGFSGRMAVRTLGRGFERKLSFAYHADRATAWADLKRDGQTARETVLSARLM